MYNHKTQQIMALNLDHVLILGSGQTGLSVENWCKRKNITSSMWHGDADTSTYINMNNITCVVISPGIMPSHPMPQKAKKLNIPVITDIDLFFSQDEALVKHTFGITGTNGKSTTTALLHHIFQNTDDKKNNTFLGGNIGTPILDLPVDKSAHYAIELSSYQLELSHKLNLFAAVLLNLTPDHLDRHGSMEQYAIEKMKIFDGCKNSLVCIDDAYSQDIYNALKKNQNTLSISCTQKADYYVDSNGDLFIKDRLITSLSNMPLKGKHNWQNMVAAFALAHIASLPETDIIQAMQSFQGLKHRLQNVKKINNVTFINDSKATNSESTEMAIRAYQDKKIYIILGGRAKANGLNALQPLFPFIQKAYLIGEAANDFSVILEKHHVAYTLSHTLLPAVTQAYKDAQIDAKESIVLLSPSCASFDQFKNFEERGDIFCDIVNKI
ncbi:MAG TPA: UDP-N-acetylmuramoyl-L-alanine--D-glutamate ligase [Holosporales bacterium]|nr:UDP-N-acetylmuramoyl-L-alanine--D-glutamate ligase [Holosporales bacterium]